MIHSKVRFGNTKIQGVGMTTEQATMVGFAGVVASGALAAFIWAGGYPFAAVIAFAGGAGLSYKYAPSLYSEQAT